MVESEPSSADGIETDIAYSDARSLVSRFRARTLSPLEVADMLLTRIERLDGKVNAVVHLDPGYTRAMARESEARYLAGRPLSPLDGVPLTVKDLCRVAGMPSRRGSAAFDAATPVMDDAPCVARLREAGAVFLAKTATPDAGCKIVTRSAVHGVTANPYDLARTPGGSSGGASAALAMGYGPLAVGTDGAGSIRIPASSTNIFGLKPSFGRVPAAAHDADMPMPVTGPMSRTVGDAAIMLAVMSVGDGRDPFAWPTPFVMPSDLSDPDLRGVRVAFSTRLGCAAPLVDDEVDTLVAGAVPLLASAGAEVVQADPAWPVDPAAPFRTLWECGYADTASRFDGARRRALAPVILYLAEQGRGRTARGVVTAIGGRVRLTMAAADFFTRHDVLVGPVMPVPPYAVERDVPEGFDDDDWSWCPYTYPWNLTGQPAASVPIGFTKAGLPVGVQIIGRRGGEEVVLRAASAIEIRNQLHRSRPTFNFKSSPKDDSRP